MDLSGGPFFMSKTRRKWCKKRRYRDKIGAMLALASTGSGKKTRRAKDEKRYYKCPDCFGWHLTSKA
jgi:hypothetical protein